MFPSAATARARIPSAGNPRFAEIHVSPPSSDTKTPALVPAMSRPAPSTTSEDTHRSFEGFGREQTPSVTVIRGTIDFPFSFAGYCSGEDGAIPAGTEARH